MNTKASELRERIRVVKQQIRRAQCKMMLNFYTDKDEVALWGAVYDELLLELNQLEVELEKVYVPLTEEQEDLALEWAIRIATHTDREL